MDGLEPFNQLTVAFAESVRAPGGRFVSVLALTKLAGVQWILQKRLFVIKTSVQLLIAE